MFFNQGKFIMGSQERGYFYIMTNAHHTVLYCGATNDLHRRVQEHKNGAYASSFTLRYNINKLVYFEIFSFAADAFAREKQVKAGSRKKKTDLIESINPEWQDLVHKLTSNTREELIRLKKFFK
jgi:putative endonuclease